MHVSKSFKKPTQAHLVVEAGEEDLSAIKRHVLQHFVGTVKIPGFREGRAPLSLVEKHTDPTRLQQEFLEHAINELYRRAAVQEKIRPVAQPQVELKKFVPFTNLVFEVDVETIGEITLPNYKTIRLAKKPVSVSAKDVNEVLESLQQRMAERVEVKRAARAGDEAVIDFAGKDTEGKDVPGAAGKDYPLPLGSKTFIPGFEDNVVGLKAGDEKDFTITFPKDYGATALQNKKVAFNVKVKKVQEVKKPKLDDEFAAKAGPFKKLAELKADIKKHVQSEKKTQADREYENELVKKITDKSSVEIPKALIEDQVTRLEEEEKQNLAYQGQTWQEHLKAEGVTEDEHRKRQYPNAEQRVKAGLVLTEIADRENIAVGEEELKIRLQMLKGQYTDPAMQAELDKPENQQDIASRMLTEKTLAKLVGYATK